MTKWITRIKPNQLHFIISRCVLIVTIILNFPDFIGAVTQVSIAAVKTIQLHISVYYPPVVVKKSNSILEIDNFRKSITFSSNSQLWFKKDEMWVDFNLQTVLNLSKRRLIDIRNSNANAADVNGDKRLAISILWIFFIEILQS